MPCCRTWRAGWTRRSGRRCRRVWPPTRRWRLRRTVWAGRWKHLAPIGGACPGIGQCQCGGSCRPVAAPASASGTGIRAAPSGSGLVDGRGGGDGGAGLCRALAADEHDPPDQFNVPAFNRRKSAAAPFRARSRRRFLPGPARPQRWQRQKRLTPETAGRSASVESDGRVQRPRCRLLSSAYL